MVCGCPCVKVDRILLSEKDMNFPMATLLVYSMGVLVLAVLHPCLGQSVSPVPWYTSADSAAATKSPNDLEPEETEPVICLPSPSSTPDTHYFKRDASVVIGALFSVFRRPKSETGSNAAADDLPFADVSDEALGNACRQFRPNNLVDLTSPFTYIITQRYNSSLHSTVSGHSIDLGYTVADSCSSLFVTSRMALKFGAETPLAGRKSFCAVRSELLPSCSNGTRAESSVAREACPANTSTPTRNMAVVVGLTESSVVLPVSTIFSISRLTHISPSATGNGFVNHSSGQLPYFFRTVPPDESQAQALIDITKHFGWQYVIALASSNDNYGTPGLIKLQEAAGPANVCIAYSTTFNSDDLQIDIILKDIILQLINHPEAKVVILFSASDEAEKLFEAIRDKRSTMADPSPLDKLWLGSDYWGTSSKLTEAKEVIEAAVPVALVVQPRLPRTFTAFMDALEENYTDYMVQLTAEKVRSQTVNPWLCRFWEEHFKCFGACANDYLGRIKYNQPCNDSTIKLTRQNLPKRGWARNILAATELAVRALQLLLDGISRDANASQVREILLKKVNSEGYMREAVTNVTLPCDQDDCRLISHVSEPIAAYSISNFGSYRIGVPNEVGYWETRSGGNILELDESKIWWKPSIPENLTSTCKVSCAIDQGRVNDPNRICCTKCVNCTDNQKSQGGEDECEPCEEHEYTSGNRTECKQLPKVYLDWHHPIGIALVVVVAVCIVLVLVTFVIFYRYRNSPVAKASDYHLMSLILVGMLIGYAVALLQIGRPGEVHCTIAKLAQSPPFIFTTATLLIKTSRLARMAIAAQRMSFSRKWTLSITAQVIFITVVTAVGVTIDLVLTLTDKPVSHPMVQKQEKVVFYVCKYNPWKSAVVDIYVIVLILITSIFAFITRKMPMNFNEARHIFLASFCLCAVWGMLAPPIYFSDTKYVAVLHALRLVTHMGAIWLFLFTPRLYIFLLRKHRNSVYADAPGNHRSRQSSQRRISSVLSSQSINNSTRNAVHIS